MKWLQRLKSWWSGKPVKTRTGKIIKPPRLSIFKQQYIKTYYQTLERIFKDKRAQDWIQSLSSAEYKTLQQQLAKQKIDPKQIVHKINTYKMSKFSLPAGLPVKLARNFKKYPEIEKWFHSKDVAWKTDVIRRIDNGTMSFEFIKDVWRQATKLTPLDHTKITNILNPNSSIGNTPIVQSSRSKIANDIAHKLGFQIGTPLGGGNQGMAWTASGNKILKITSNPGEAASALRARGRTTTKHLVISDVRPLRINGQTTRFYVLTMDAVRTLTPQEQAIWRYGYREFLGTDSNIGKQKNARFQRWVNDQLKLLPRVNINPGEFELFWTNILPQRQSIINDFSKMKLNPYEAHQGNIGFDAQGKLKHFDFWSQYPKDMSHTGGSGLGVGAYSPSIEAHAYKYKPINVDIDLSKI